jgi:thiol-disulfide isomerase/thioredoxin
MTQKGFILILIPVMAVFISCAHRPHRQSSSPVEVAGELMMIGPVSYADILAQFPAWKRVDRNSQPTDEVINGIKGIDVPLAIQCFLGTWCSDSRHEVPPFMKSLSLAGNSHIRIELIGVDRQKDDPAHLGPMNNIELVPTFIVRSNGVELFRMVELPETTFAEDLLNDLKKGR